MTPETLAEEHYAYALRLYARYVRKLPTHVDREAIRGAALEGLVKSSQSFNEGLGVPFKNWAARRVIGQMRDEMRVQDHLSRRMRERVNDQSANEKILADTEAPLSLDEELRKFTAEGVNYGDVISDPNGEEDPWEEHSRLSCDQVHALMGALPEREFKVVILRYYENMRVAEVALSMGLSESRVNQLETSALKSMRISALQVAA